MFDTHIRQRNEITFGRLLRSTHVYPNTWVLAGNYRPSLCRRIMEKYPSAFRSM